MGQRRSSARWPDWNPAEIRLDADDPRQRRRRPDRAAAVGAERERANTRCDRSDGAAARAAGSESEIPGVRRVAVHEASRIAAIAELGCRRLTDDDSARFSQPFD